MTEIGYAAKIAPELADLAWDIKSFRRHPENAQEHNLPAIAESLTYHGQRTPIVVQAGTMLIVKGNGTHEAAELLGWSEIAAVVQEMSDEDALKYLLADNRASALARFNARRGKALLDRMSDMQGTLFTDDDIEDMADPIVRPVAEFRGDYADAGEEAEARAERSQRTGAKMKEVPVVLTEADHALFIGNLQVLMKRWGLTGYRQTIVEAVRRSVEPAATGDRTAILKELRDYFLTDGRPTWTTGAIAAFFQSQMAAPAPATEEETTPVAEGQTSIWEQLQ